MYSTVFRKQLKRWIPLAFVCLIYSCVDEFEAEIVNFEGALVIDARITDQAGLQTVWLSRTFDFETDDPSPEQNAQITIVDDLGTSYAFQETAPGQYVHTTSVPFQVDREYQLMIETNEGARFASKPERLPQQVAIGDMRFERRVNSAGTEGVSVLLNNQTGTSTPNYFRYEYEETFKVIAPEFNPFEWGEVDYDYFCNDDDGWDVEVIPRTEEAQTCFGSDRSSGLVLASTADISSDGLQDFEVRFLGKDNYYITHRYSILVKQYHHSVDAASFFRTLEDFSSSESVFSNVQPGLLESNINPMNSDALIIGYFELSSYSEKRMFFSHEDLFPGEPSPPYPLRCSFAREPALYPEGFHATIIDGKIVIDGTSNSPLLDGVIAGLIAFVGENETFGQLDGNGDIDRAPFMTKPLGCVDCRAFGSNIRPDFWVE